MAALKPGPSPIPFPECFEPHRLLEVSRAAPIASPRQWVEQVVAAVGTAEQSDDLTLLAVARPLSMNAPTVE